MHITVRHLPLLRRRNHATVHDGPSFFHHCELESPTYQCESTAAHLHLHCINDQQPSPLDAVNPPSNDAVVLDPASLSIRTTAGIFRPQPPQIYDPEPLHRFITGKSIPAARNNLRRTRTPESSRKPHLRHEEQSRSKHTSLPLPN